MLTVVAPAAHQRLATPTALGVVLAGTGVAPTDPAFLSAAIEQASAAIASSCRRAFALETVRETFRPDCARPRLILSRWPVVTIKTVTINGDAIDLTTVEAERGGVLHRLDARGYSVGWPSGPSVVTYDAGYVLPEDASPTLPADLQRACVLLAKGWIENQSRNHHLRRERIEGVMEAEYFPIDAAGIGADVEALIAPYRAVDFTGPA